MASESRSNVPASTSSWASASYSSAEPSHQSTSSGLVSAAISSTQACSFLFCVGTVVWLTGFGGSLGRWRGSEGPGRYRTPETRDPTCLARRRLAVASSVQ